MNALIRFSLGLLAALGMVALVFGALLLSLSEDPGSVVAFNPSPSAVAPTTASSPVTPPPGITLVVLSPIPSATEQSVVTLCPPLPGWQPYTVLSGDQIDTLASSAGITAEALIQANCLISANLLPGTLLYLPPSPTPEFSATITLTKAAATDPVSATASPSHTSQPRPVCVAPTGWVFYTVQTGDTLYKISQAFGVSVYQLQQANCLAGTLIQAGSRIYVPNVPTRTPAVTATPTATHTAPPPTATLTLVPTHTNTVALPTDTPSPTPSDTPAPPTTTLTDVPTVTPTVIPNTATQQPSATNTTGPTTP